MPTKQILFITLTLLGTGCLSGCSEEPRGEPRRLVQEVCLGYDDLRGRNVIRLENDPEIQQIHQRANEICDLVDDGRAAAAESDAR